MASVDIQQIFAHKLFYHFLFILLSIVGPTPNYCSLKYHSKLWNKRKCWKTLHKLINTLQLHYNSVVRVHVKKTRYNGSHYTRDRCSKSLTRPLSQVFTYVNKCPIHRHLVWDISYVFSSIVITHKLFINRGINRCTCILVE